MMFFVFFLKQKTAYEMRISDWISDMCSSELVKVRGGDYVNVRTRQQERLTLSEYIERYVRPWEYDGRDIADTGSLPRYAGNTPLSRENFEALGFRYPECFEGAMRSEEHTSELQSLMRISYAVFCLKINKKHQTTNYKYTL